jgi:hypothetical protein
MGCFNAFSHGMQDLYALALTAATVAVLIMFVMGLGRERKGAALS